MQVYNNFLNDVKANCQHVAIAIRHLFQLFDILHTSYSKIICVVSLTRAELIYATVTQKHL